MADKTTTNWSDFTPVGVAPQTTPPSTAPSTGVNWDDFKPAGETGGAASDLGKSLKVGAQRLPGMVTGLADLPFALAAGARPVTKAADALGEATGFQPGKWADETKFSPAYNEGKANIDKAWKDGSAGDIALSYLQNPAYTANQVVESVPSMVAGGLAGRALMGVGRVAAPLAKAGGVGPAAPGVLARTVGEKLAAPLAGGIGEGAVTAGQQMQQYQGEDQQKNAVASLGAGLGTTALGFGAGRVANKFGLETAETAIINAGRDGAVRAADSVPMSAKRRILSGMVSEGVLQELPQSVQEQMWQNYAEGKPLTEGIARAGVEGALAGAVMGAGANVSDGGANKRAKQQTIAERLAAEAESAAAQDAALPPTMDTIAGDLINPVNREPATFADLVTPKPPQELDPYSAWEQQASASQAGTAPIPNVEPQVAPSVAMGINPSNGALSKAAAMAVDTGVAQEAQFLGATGRDLQPRRTGPGVTNESDVIDVQGRVIEDRSIATPRRLDEQRDGMAARALGDSLANQPSRTSSAVPALGGPVGDDRARGPATAIPDGSSNGGRSGGRPATGPGNPESGAAQPGGRGNGNPALTKGAPNTQTSTPSTAPRSQSVPAARPGAVEAAGVERSKLLASLDQTGATREMVLDAQLKDAQYRLAQITATTGILPADRASRLSAINQEIADLNAVRDQARELDERDRREGNTRSMLQGARQELDAAVRAGAVTPEAAQSIAAEAKKTGNAAGASEAIFTAVDSSTTGVASESQASQTQQSSTQSTQARGPQAGAATATASTSPAGGNRVQAAGLTNGAPTQNPGAQTAPAAGAQAQAPQGPVARPDGWRKTMLRAAPIARSMGIDPTGKRLAQVVAEIDARDTRAPAPPALQPAPGPVRIGRNNAPLNEGGKPFKTRKAAGDAKKLQPMMRVVTVPGGYALAEKTPAQLAAEERASRRLRNPNTSAPGAPIPAHAFIAAAGGLSRAAAADMGVDGNPRIGNRTLFAGQGRGLSMDQATQMLIQDGYLSEGASINDALALVKTSLTRPQYNADGIERIAEAEVQAQFEDYLAAQEEAAAEGDADPFGMANEFTAEELDDVGYTDADPALQAEVAALITQAEANGIDTYAILEDIARTYANATQDHYNAAARDALAQAIARGNQDGGSTAAQAAPAAEPAADQGLDQPPALELASQTPAEAAAQQEAQEQAAKAEAARQRAADAQAARDEERKRIAQASVRAADTFELGQDPLDSLTGQGSIFDAPDQPQQAPAATEPVAQPITRADVEDAQQQARADNRKKVKQGAAEASPIEDAGEKIGGARKDRWKERGLNLDDLDAMTEAEGAELATKANVWKPDYEALSEASEPVTAALVKTIYDQLAAKPKKNTPEGRRQYVQMMRIVRDVYTEAKGPEAVKNAYLEIRKRAGLNAADPAAKSAGRELLFSVYKGRSDPFVLGYTEMSKAKKLVEDGFPAKAAPWKSRLSVSRMDGGPGTTERGIEMYMERSAEAGTPLTREQILAGFYRVNTKDSKTVAYAPTKADAEAAAATIYERDMKGKKDGKPEPVRPNLDELKRENLPQRIDRDVTSEDFVRDLGFRGVEFGNWSAQDERQRILNMAYDGLMDLAEIMGVPPKAMSLNGTLGMAFGARGGGRFAAHYEPGKLVINMTKIRGGGSMAHEWAHAMDHYFGELNKPDAYTTQARGASGWYSEDQYNGVPRKRMERVGNEWKNVEKMRLDNLRPEMAAAFDEVMRALFQKQITKAEMVRSQELDLERTEALARNEQDADMRAMYANMAENKRQALEELRKDPDDKMYAGRGRTDYANQAQALSGKSENGYWTRPTEMFARAFESWVFDRVTAMGARSDYLVHGVEEDRFAGGAYKGNPYPAGEERARINAAFDKLATTVKTKETDKGVAMFSRDQEAMSPELARMLVAMGRPPGTATKESVRSAVRELVGGLGALSNNLGRVVVATAAEIKRDWEPLIGPTGMEASGEAGQAQGFYDPKTKTVFVIADHIRAGDEIGVVAHELMHKHGQAVLGEAGWNQLHTAIESWADADTGSVERRVYDEAVARVEASRPSDMNIPEYTTQELFPYAVQVALEMGIRPNGLAKPDTVSRWLAQVRSMLRQVWNKIAGQKGDFNSLDLVNLAFGIAQRENPAHVTELDAATAERAQNAEDALKQISDQEDLFTQPKSNATTIQEIVAEHDPEIKVRTTDLGGETMYTLTMPDGTRATITSREPTKDEVFGMDPNTGRWISERPGEKAPPKGTRSDVWIDVSALKPGQNGARVYNIASTFAHNTGRIFIGDPSGLSDMALRRRAEQMLSSALKFGTTDHIAPHPRQVAGDAALGVPPLRWVYGDHAGNIERLIDVNQQALENAFPEAKNLQYDLDTGNFIDARTGETVDPVRFDAGRERGVPARDGAGLVAGADGRGTDGLLGAPGAGWRTVARGAVFRSLLRQGDSSGAGPGDQRGAGPGTGRSEVVDGPVRQRDQPDSLTDRNIQGGGSLLDGLAAQRSRLAADNPKRRIFYSRAATAVAADYTPTQQAAAEKAFGTITKQTLAERAQAFRANMGTKLRQGLVDQFAPIKEVSQQAYMLARMSKGSDGAVEAALLYGKPFLRDGVTDVNMQDGGFANVLASLKGEHDRFFQWVAAQRAERLKAEGKENLLTNTDIAALRSLNAGKMADGTVRMPLYAKALQELNAFNEASLKVAMESGLIDQAAYDLMRDQPYVPFYRLMEEGDMRGPRFSSGLTNQQAWKKLKGGTQQLNADLLQNTLLNWSHLYAAAARNRAALVTMTEAENLGIAYQVPADTKGSTKVMRDGVAEHWMVEDPYLLEAISALNYTPGGIAKALAPFKRLLTFGVTVNPTFKIRNLIRDSLSAIAQSDLSYNPAENVAKGWKATSKGSQTYASMLASGGIIKFGTQENTNHLRGQIERLGGTMLDKQGWEKFTGQMRSLWETYEEFGDRTENVNRAALYERLRAKGLSHAEASFQARDLMDFSMSGKWGAVRFLTQTVPFLNARLQGLYKLGRAAKEDPRRFAAMAGAVSMASLALLAAYSDDEDWKKREDWDRDNFWWFKVGEIAFRIPKPFEVGAIGTVAERTAELMLSDEMTGKRFGQRISDMVFNTFAMDPTPQAIKPFLDVYANKDSFSGRAIEGMADERLRPQDRYNERTSEVARLLGSWGLPDPVRLAKGDYAGLSPKQIDFLLRGYFGWLATVSNTATDAIAKPLLGRGERPEPKLRDAFLAGNFVESLPSGSSRYVTAMYEQARDVEQAWASYQAAIKSGDIEKAREIQQEEAPKLRSRMAVENAKSQIADLNARAKRIESDKLMSAQAKRAKLDEIEALRNRVAERVAVRN